MPEEKKSFFTQFNIPAQCRRYRIGLWRCPQFLFLFMGIVIIAAIFSTNLLTRRYAGPETGALVALGVTAFLLIVGQVIISAFEKVAQAALAKSEFISIMSHQLRGPLTAIRWQMNLFFQHIERGDALTLDQHQEAMRAIEEENRQMIRVVNDLLEVNRIEDRGLALRPSDVSLTKITQQLIKEYEYFSRSMNIEVIARFPEKDAIAHVDEEHLRMAIEHLLDNAIRYSKGKGAVIVAIERLPGAFRWSITDDGIGIPVEDQRHMFEKFFRGNSALRYQTEGIGVGLYFVKAVIEESGGTIGFQSQYGRGSVFWFILPAK